jgi:hemolysin activation/secretion protein
MAVLAAAAPLSLAQLAPKAPEDSPRFEIRRYVFEGASLIPSEHLAARTRPFTGPGRTFGDVQRALEAVERAYAEAGYSAVQVVLPEQELARGEIRFHIVEARIGRVIVEGNKFFDEANIRASVPALAPGRSPNVNEIARSLRLANENPSKQESVLLRSGQAEATIDAVVRVVDEKPTKYSVTLDNTGNQQTGRLRTGLGYQNANTSGRDDVLTLQYVTAPYTGHRSPDGEIDRLGFPSGNVTILGAGYRVPLYELGDSLDFSVGHSNVNSGTVAGLFNITGRGTLLGSRYTRNLDKIGDYEQRLALSLDYRSYENKGVRLASGEPIQLIPDVVVHPISLLYSGLYRRPDHETGFIFGLSKNFAGGNDGTGADLCASRDNGLGQCARGDYLIWRWGFNHNRALAGDWQMRLAMNGQITSDMLVSGEQFGLGGADSVRGFLEREIANDSGYRGSLEIYTPDFGARSAISGARSRALAFLDWGYVHRNHPGPAEIRQQHVAAVGAGLRFSRGASLAFRVDWGLVADEGGLQRRGDSRVHASISYVF